jgi:hypothetical protein
VRKSQEQARKSRDAVVGVVRAGSELAKAVRPSATRPTVHIPGPAAMRAHAQDLAGQAVSAQRDLAAKAFHAASPYAERVLTAQRELADRARQAGVAEQVAAAQRTLAGRLSEVAKVATPFVAEGRTRLTQLVSALQPGQQAAGAADEKAHDVASAAAATAEQPAAPEPKATASRASTAKARTAKPSTAKTSTAKTSTAKTSTAKPSTAKTSTAKPSTAKTSTRQAAGSKPRSAPKK